MRPRQKRRDIKRHKISTKINSSFLDKINLETLLKLPFGIVALFYIVGIFVQGFYYGRYGINSLSLFKLSYIMAGFWACFHTLFPILIFALIIGFFFYKKFYFPNQINTRLRLTISIFLLIGLIIGSCCLYYLITYRMVFSPTSEDLFYIYGDEGLTLVDAYSFVMYKEYLFTSLKFSFIGLVLFGFSIWINNNIKNPIGKGLILTIILFIFTCCLLFITNEFSRLIYGRIPAFIGGGAFRPITATIKINKGAAPELIDYYDHRLSSLFSDNSNYNDSVDNDKKSEDIVFIMHGTLILESEGDFYFENSLQKVVRVSKDKVLSINYNSSMFIGVEK